GAGLRSNGARQGGGFSVNAYLLKYPPAPSLAADGNAQDDEGSIPPSGEEPDRTPDLPGENENDVKSHFTSSKRNTPGSSRRCETGLSDDAKPIAPTMRNRISP